MDDNQVHEPSSVEQDPNSRFYERVNKDPKHKIWGGYHTHSPGKLASWMGGGCALVLLISLLLLGLILAISYQFAHLIFPKNTDEAVHRLEERVRVLENQ